MLPTDHNHTIYEPLEFRLGRTNPDVPLRPVVCVAGDSELLFAAQQLEIAESISSLEEFADRFMTHRDELALRSLSGHALTAREQVQLKALNAALEALLPKPEPLPDATLNAMAELKRLLAR